jgi:GT2 family glycosyltransferase
MADTSIILVNWNGRADTLACLQSLRRLDGGDFGVVVVDNGSADGSVEAIAAWAREAAPPGWLQLVEAGANLGFAAANNLGMELAKKTRNAAISGC